MRISDAERAWAYGRELKGDDRAEIRYFALDARLAEVWDELRDDVLDEWTGDNPGTRPALWWEREAPEPRQRTGGTGRPMFELLAVKARFNEGIPTDWSEVDPEDPPEFESQAAFLDRLDLLTIEERSALAVAGWPDDEVLDLGDDEA